MHVCMHTLTATAHWTCDTQVQYIQWSKFVSFKPALAALIANNSAAYNVAQCNIILLDHSTAFATAEEAYRESSDYLLSGNGPATNSNKTVKVEHSVPLPGTFSPNCGVAQLQSQSFLQQCPCMHTRTAAQGRSGGSHWHAYCLHAVTMHNGWLLMTDATITCGVPQFGVTQVLDDYVLYGVRQMCTNMLLTFQNALNEFLGEEVLYSSSLRTPHELANSWQAYAGDWPRY